MNILGLGYAMFRRIASMRLASSVLLLALFQASIGGYVFPLTALAVQSGASSAAPTGRVLGAAAPALPRVYINSALSNTPTSRVVSVPAGASLQAAIDSAQPGDKLELEPGATYSGQIQLPAKSGSGWIVITTRGFNIREGVRIGPGQAGLMAKLVHTTTDTILTAQGAHHYRLLGLEITTSHATTGFTNYGLISLGSGSETSVSQLPHDIIIDRSYIHGTPTGNIRRCVALNSAAAAIVDSYLTDCHEVGSDSQAIVGWNGPGPFKIVNNYLAGAGENVMFGGADPSIPNLVPADIEFRGNLVQKPWSWYTGDPSYAGTHWSVKNLFELKNAERVLVDGNVFENHWVDAQSGASILLTPRNQDGRCPWCVTRDVTFSNNLVQHAPAGLNILGKDYLNPSQTTTRVAVRNNLFDDIGRQALGGNGRLIQMTESADNILFDHNTLLNNTGGSVAVLAGGVNNNVVFTNNIGFAAAGGIIGDSVGEGNAAISRYWPGAVVTKNVFPGRSASLYSNYPNNYFPASVNEVGFVSYRSGNGGEYRLLASSPYKGAGTDGKDIGADMDALAAALLLANYTPPPPGPTPPPPPPGSTVPTIDRFVATPQSITPGQSTTLAWSVTGANLLSISPGVGAVTGTSTIVAPTTTTTYTLVATNSVGSSSQAVTVTVSNSTNPPPPPGPTPPPPPSPVPPPPPSPNPNPPPPTPTPPPSPVPPPPPSPVPPPPPGNTGQNNPPTGWLDSVTCDAGAKGWVYDPDNAEAAVTVHLYMDGKAGAGGKLITSGVTTEPRGDVNTLFNISGNHGFIIPLPDAARDGKQHTLYAYGIDTTGGTNPLLGGGGRTFNCVNPTGAGTNPTPVTVTDKTLPVGWFDNANCFQFTGWAFDQDNPTASITVHFYVDLQPGKPGAKVFGDQVTNVVRDDVNKLYGITGTHGFVYRFASAGANPMADGKEHRIYAYAINTNGGENPLLGGSPKVVKCAGTGPGPNSGEGGGRSNRHNYLSKCNGNGDYNDKEDPAISAERLADGTIRLTVTPLPGQTIVLTGPDGKPLTPGPGGTYILPSLPDNSLSTITVGNHAYYVDADGLTGTGDTASILIPVPCIRIGYDDVMGGDQCGDGQAGTCAKELDAFINVDGIQNSGLHVHSPNNKGFNIPDDPDEFVVQYIIKGGPSATKGWQDYDWRGCGQYSNHCIRLKGKGVICARTKLASGNHFSLTTCKKFDAETGDDGLDDYDPL